MAGERANGGLPPSGSTNVHVMKTTMKIGLVVGLWAVAAGLALGQSGGGLGISTQNGQATVTFNGRQVWAGPVHGAATGRSSSGNGVVYAAAYDGDRLLWENTPGAARQLDPGANPGTGLDTEKFRREHQQNVERLQEEQRQFLQQHPQNPPLQTHRPNSLTNRGGTEIFRNSGGSVSGGGSGRSGPSGGSGSGSASGSHTTLSTGDATLKRADGDTTLLWKGQTRNLSKTTGQLSLKSASQNGTEYLAAFEGNRVIWENVPGAAQHLH